MTLGVPVSVDTDKPEVMRAALDLGADIVNDIWALRAPGALEAVAAHPACGVCLMHMHGEPQTMQARADVRRRGRRGARLPGERVRRRCAARRRARRASCSTRASASARRSTHNLELLRAPARAAGARPSAAGRLVAQVDARRASPGRAGRRAAWSPSVAAALLAVERGARIVRVHDVAATVDALAGLAGAAACRDGDNRRLTTHQHDHEQDLFRHRRHPRHGRPAADHARLHAAPRPCGRPRAQASRGRARPC